MDIDAIIKAAKLGRERRDAQVDTCAVFAAALYDVLTAQGISCQMKTVVPKGLAKWAHAVVEVEGRYYDSMGEFSAGIYRVRTKIHPTVKFTFNYKADSRIECYEPEFDELHAFFIKMLNKAICGLAAAKAAWQGKDDNANAYTACGIII